MPPKSILFDADARSGLMRGVDLLASAVRVTLGPKGRNVIIEQPSGTPQITKDGVTVADAVELAERFPNMGAMMLKEAATRANDEAGDGTTTAIVLAQAIIRGGMRAVAAGAAPMDVRRGIDLAAQTAVAALKAAARPVSGTNEVAQVATVAANGEALIGRQIAEAMEKVGRHGVITVEENQRLDTETEIVEGMQFERGYISPYFITDTAKMIITLDDPLIFLCEAKLSTLVPMVPLLEKVLKLDRPILVIAEDIQGEALASLVVNKLRGNLRVAAVRAPGFGDRSKAILQDIAVLTGGAVFSADLGMKLETVGVEILGSVRHVIITRDLTTLIGGTGSPEAIASRVAQIRHEIGQSDSDFDIQVLRERAAKLAGGVAVMRVGGNSEIEVRERRDRVEDALAATRAAVEEGVLPGGGVALLNAGKALAGLNPVNADQATGVAVVRVALEAPLRRIAANAGVDGSVVAGHVRDSADPGFGYDAQADRYGDMFGFGIVDPAKVVRIALSSAASVAGLMITTDALIADAPRPHRVSIEANG